MATAKNALIIVLDIDEVDVDDDYNSEAALHCRFWEKFISCRIRLLSRTPTKEWRETQRNSRVVPSPQTPISILIYDLTSSLIPNISKKCVKWNSRFVPHSQILFFVSSLIPNSNKRMKKNSKKVKGCPQSPNLNLFSYLLSYFISYPQHQ